MKINLKLEKTFVLDTDSDIGTDILECINNSLEADEQLENLTDASDDEIRNAVLDMLAEGAAYETFDLDEPDENDFIVISIEKDGTPAPAEQVNKSVKPIGDDEIPF